jgi:sialic acid synthase SpsE
MTPNDSERVHVIAEAGTNHNADVETGTRLIDAAADAGADSVKFQIIYPEGLYLTHLWQGDELVENEVVAIRRRGMLPDEGYARFARHAQARGIPISASVFDERSLALLESFDPPYVKIASCDLTNVPLLRQAAATGRKLVVSTGMASLAEIQTSVKALTDAGHRDVVLLHCVSVYPCPTSEMNLGFLTTLRSEFGLPVGLSDHTEEDIAAPMAVALGATWIEKHFTLDRSSEGFDHAYAMEPEALTRYVAAIRAAEGAMAPRSEKTSPAEAETARRARRGIYAARDLAAGCVLTEDDLLVVRPEGAFSPQAYDDLLGRRLATDLPRFKPLTPEALG